MVLFSRLILLGFLYIAFKLSKSKPFYLKIPLTNPIKNENNKQNRNVKKTLKRKEKILELQCFGSLVLFTGSTDDEGISHEARVIDLHTS